MEKNKSHGMDLKHIMRLLPCADLSIENVLALVGEIKTEMELATLYALVENKAWWIEDDIYDYDTGTDGYRNACDITNKWFSVANELGKRIFIILRSEKTVIPERGYNTVLKPFMERNGFVDGRGWWIHKEKAETISRGLYVTKR